MRPLLRSTPRLRRGLQEHHAHDEAVSDMIGRTLAHYQILAPLGEGGMGVVYKARDTHLDRFVAIKVLRPDKIADAERKRRFVQEAKAASALNHPNIVHVYDIAEAEGIDYIAMEYIQGRTLDQLIGRKGLKFGDTLKYGVQIADALSRAHAAGIIHRDLKPGNIIVDEHGLVKVVDFGLAKLTETSPSSDGDLTLTRRDTTGEGVIVGTVAYMSPEQAEGKKVDARSDIFSFGAVLYEMATGRRAFHGATTISTLAAILHHEPTSVRELVAATPPELEKIIARCLRKDPDRRIQHMDDVKLALEELREESTADARLPARDIAAHRPSRTAIGLASGVVLILAAAGVAWWLRQSPAPPGAPDRGATVLTPITADSGLSCDPALSPDGKLLAYASDRSGDGNLDIWVQQVGGGDPVRLTRHAADDYQPSFSPDGTLIAFSSQRQGQSAGIYVIPSLSGEERLIAARGRRPRFSPDGAWLAYWDADKIYVVATGGGSPRPLAPEFLIATYPVWFPDGKRLLFAGNRAAPGSYIDDWYIVPLDGGAVRGIGAAELLRRYDLRGTYGRLLIGILPEVSPRGDAVIFSATAQASTNLWQMRISPETGQLSGEPEQLTFLASEPGLGFQPSAALSGDALRVAFWNVTANVDVWSLALESSRGKSLGQMKRLTRNAAVEQWASLSLDGKVMAYNVRTRENWDVWLMDLETGRQVPLVVGPLAELWPKVTRDGRRVAYALEDGTKQEIYILTLGAPVPEKVCENCTEPWGWSSDGHHLLYRTGLPRKIGVLGPNEPGKIALEHPEYSLNSPRISPDDRWIAFSAQTSTAGSTLFIAPFRGATEIPRGEWHAVSDSSATYNSAAGWSTDGHLVYFMSERDGSRCLWAQRLDPATKRPDGPPFEVQPFHRAQIRSMGLWQPGSAGTALEGNTMVFSIVEATGNIWMAEVK